MSSESESVSPGPIEKCSLVLVDVAGTTTSLNFVKDTLFPFVAAQVEDFLKSKWEEEPVKECINLIKDGYDLDLAAATEKVKTLTQEDSGNKGLKTLQGLIYKEGYEKGDLKAHIFDDVAEALESWAKNRRVAVYSTGSVDSQKLLFSHTTKGDLSAHIHKYFDQEIGLKTESDSYKKIAKEVEVAPEEVVFITDDIKEATAAKNGGVTAVLIKREGNAELPEEVKEFTVISSFKDLALEKAAKRKNEEEAPAEEAPPAKVAKTDSEEPEKPLQTEEKVEQTESMEVDTEKKPEETETTAASEPTPETEKCVEPEPEKTETKEETAESEKKEEKMETETKEEKVEEAVEETKEKETEETVTKEEEKVTKEEEKVTKEEEKVTKGEEKVTNEEEKKEEVKPAEESPKEEEETKDCVEGEKSMENGDEKAETKAEEKENKSVLANGVENGKEEEKSGEASEEQSEEQTEEVKVKKLEESAESKTVSVEV